jgi:hypothetical protein
MYTMLLLLGAALKKLYCMNLKIYFFIKIPLMDLPGIVYQISLYKLADILQDFLPSVFIPYSSPKQIRKLIDFHRYIQKASPVKGIVSRDGLSTETIGG